MFVRARATALLLALTFACLASDLRRAAAQRPPDETVQSLAVPDGFEIKLFAAEPMIVNPIAMDVDTYGRVWVTEGVNYRRNVANPPDNKLKVLEDTDGDGVADKMTVFASDLNAAMGVCVAGTKIYVPESPHLYVYEDADGDLKPDGPRKTLLTGWGGQNHDHGLHSLIFGPDHKLYMTMGDTGYDVTGPDGRHIKFPWGAMIRCEADGTGLEDFAVNFRNPFELGVDSFGNVWCSDNDNDGLKSVRICWILEGGNYGWFGRPEEIRNPDGSFDPIHHWRADKPGFVPYVLITGFGSPCGMTIYEGDAFGPRLRGGILHCDAGPREVRLYTPQRRPGVGFDAKLENLVTGTDPYFRPDDVVAAPDGSLYVSDWYDGGVGGHAYNDPTRGRIYRLTPADRKLERKEKPGPYANDADALAALASPNLATQFLAREWFLSRGEAAVHALAPLVEGGDDDRILRARALWLLDRIGGRGRAFVARELSSTDPQFRALAVRILRRRGAEYEQQILSRAHDSDDEVQKEVLLAIPNFKSERAQQELIEAAQRYDGNDRYYLETLKIAAKGRERLLFELVVEKSDEVVSPRLVNLVRILRPDGATEYLTSRLRAANLPDESRVALLAALGATPSPEAGRSLIGLLASSAPLETRLLVLDSLRQNLNGPWKELKNADALADGLKKSLAEPALQTAALRLIASAGLAERAPDAARLLSAPQLPEGVRLAAIDAVTRLQFAEAGPALAKLAVADSESVAAAARKGLVAVGDMKSIGSLLADSAASAALQGDLVDLLVSGQEGAFFLLRLIETKKLAPQLADRAIAAALEHPDVNVRLMYEKFVPPDQRPKTLGEEFSADDILKLTGDAARGESVFLRSGAASCIKCHRVKGRGNDVGPDLSQIGRKYEKRALLETILKPSMGIAPEYQPHVVELDSGRILVGFLLSQSADGLTLKTPEGFVYQVNRDQIVDLVKTEVSLMPELLLKNVTAQDAADLLAYLSGLQASEVFASSFRVLGPFPNRKKEDRTQDFGPETETSVSITKVYSGLNNAELKWTRAEAQGTATVPQIDLRQLAATLQQPGENVIYYFATTLTSAADQEAALRVGSDDGIQVWVNGKKVHDHAVTRALTPGEDEVKVRLKQGANHILLKLDQGSGPAGLTLSAEAKSNLTFSLP